MRLKKSSKDNHRLRIERRGLGYAASQEIQKDPIVESLPKLEVLENDIRSRLLQIHINKREVLKSLLMIYQNKDFYFKGHQKYLENFQCYIEERIKQAPDTSRVDAKIIRLVDKHGAESVFDDEVSDLVYLLKRISQVNDESVQKRLLTDIKSLNRNELKKIIPQKKSLSSYQGHGNLKDIKVKTDATNGVVTIRSKNTAMIKKISRLVGNLTEENIDRVIDSLEKS